MFGEVYSLREIGHGMSTGARWTNQYHVIHTRHNSADSVPTSNLVCIKEVAIRTTFCIAGLIYYTWYLVTGS